MKDGVIQHVGRPEDIYLRPANLFVATFIGRSNVIDARVCVRDGEKGILFFGTSFLPMKELTEESAEQNVKVAVRPEEIVLCEGGEGMHGIVTDRVFLGSNTHYTIRLEDDCEVEMIQESNLSGTIPVGTDVCVTFKKEKINVFTEDGAKNLVRGVKNDA